MKAFTCAITVLLLVGCAGTDTYIAPMHNPLSREGYVTPLAARHTFGPGETPMVIVSKYPTKTVTVKVHRTSGELVTEETQRMPPSGGFMNDHWYGFNFPDLGAGNYTAFVNVDGFTRETINFAVRK